AVAAALLRFVVVAFFTALQGTDLVDRTPPRPLRRAGAVELVEHLPQEDARQRPPPALTAARVCRRRASPQLPVSLVLAEEPAGPAARAVAGAGSAHFFTTGSTGNTGERKARKEWFWFLFSPWSPCSPWF